MSCDVGEVAERLKMSRAHSPTFPSFHLRHSSFSKPFRRFTYVTVHSPTLSLLHLRHSKAHSPTFPSLHLCHSSFSNPSVALPMSQFILQPFRCFTYVTAHSPTLLSLLLRHRLFTWRAAHETYICITGHMLTWKFGVFTYFQ